MCSPVGNKLADELVAAMAELLVPNHTLLMPHLKARDRRVRSIQDHLARFTQAAADLAAQDRRGHGRRFLPDGEEAEP